MDMSLVCLWFCIKRSDFRTAFYPICSRGTVELIDFGGTFCYQV